VAISALESLEKHAGRVAAYFGEQGRQMQAMLAMLTETVADISGQSEVSVARLLAIERRIEEASSLEDVRELKASLAVCLAGVKEAVAEQRRANLSTVSRLRDQIQRAAGPRISEAAVAEAPVAGGEGAEARYVVAFRLQRAEAIRARFGEKTVDEMLAVMAEGLKAAAGPSDRLIRWKKAGACGCGGGEDEPAIRGSRHQLRASGCGGGLDGFRGGAVRIARSANDGSGFVPRE
jgi:hypothetical protein